MNRWVLSAVLKVSRVGMFLISGGSEFQRVGAETLKALSPKVRSLVRGVVSTPESEDLRFRGGVWMWRRSDRYWGARAWRDL